VILVWKNNLAVTPLSNVCLVIHLAGHVLDWEFLIANLAIILINPMMFLQKFALNANLGNTVIQH